MQMFWTWLDQFTGEGDAKKFGFMDYLNGVTVKEAQLGEEVAILGEIKADHLCFLEVKFHLVVSGEGSFIIQLSSIQ